MINQLQMGEIPPAAPHTSLLKVALIKKQGVLQQPPACWSSDPKINPDAKHLLWAAALFGNEDDLHTAAGIMVNEMISRPGKKEAGYELSFVNEKLMEVVDLAPTSEFAAVLKKKAAKAWQALSENNIG